MEPNQPSQPPSPARWRAGDSDRDATVAQLREAMAHGRLTMAEFDQRQDQALAARFTDELDGLVADLPAPSTAPVLPGQHDGLPVRATGREVVPGSLPPVRSVSVMSGRDLSVEPGVDRLSCLQVMGGDNIDLTEALGPGVVVTVEVTAIMGGSTIVVPAGVRVVDECFAIMGGNDVKRGARGDGSNGTVVLKGLVLMGGHCVKVAKGD